MWFSHPVWMVNPVDLDCPDWFCWCDEVAYPWGSMSTYRSKIEMPKYSYICVNAWFWLHLPERVGNPSDFVGNRERTAGILYLEDAHASWSWPYAVQNRDEWSFCHLKLWHLSEIPWQNVINRDLFRIDRSSYMGPCHFSPVLTAFYGKIMVTPANVAKFWLRTSNNACRRQKTRFTANVSK